MNAFSAEWAKLDRKFVALTRRERVIVAVAVLFGGAFLIFNFGIDPFLVKARNSSRTEAATNAELTQQQALIAMLQGENADPDAHSRRRMAMAQQELKAIGGRIATFEASMVPPERMQAFLEGLLTRNRAIELMGLKTLPVTLIGAQVGLTGKDATAGTAVLKDKSRSTDLPTEAQSSPISVEGIYQHGIEIRLAGNYNDLLNYLAELERMPQRLMWNNISLNVEKYPRNMLVLRVFTLSLDRNWLVV